MEESEMRKEIERLENLLDGRRKIGKKRLLKIGIASALALLPIVPVKAHLDNLQAIHQKKADLEISQIRQESIERIFDINEYKKHRKIIKKVSEETDVPEYILAALIDEHEDSRLAAANGVDPVWIRESLTSILGRNVGIRETRLENPELALRAAAKHYRDCLEACGNEKEALIRYGCMNQISTADWQARIRRAKAEAETAQRWHDRYEQIRKNPKYVELVKLVEQAYKIDEIIAQIPDDPTKGVEWGTRYHQIANKHGRRELCERISAIADREFKDQDFRWYLLAKHHNEESRWWVNNAPYDDLVKRTLKIKQSSQKE